MSDSSEGLAIGQNNEFLLRLAADGDCRLKCWGLVYREYLALGYAEPNPLEARYNLHDALPDTATFLVEHNAQPVGTVTVFPDSPLGLPADEIYKQELDGLRQAGRRLVEVGRLTIGREQANNRHILAALFDILYLYSREVMEVTDLVITVNPSHSRFYERMLIFEPIGAEKDLGSVRGAPAVLMRMDLQRQWEMRRWEHNEGPKPDWYKGGHTFHTLPDEHLRVEWLRRVKRIPSEAFLKMYFVQERPWLIQAKEPIRRYICECYPDYSLLNGHGSET